MTLTLLNMTQAEASSSRNQDSDPGYQTSQDDIKREPIPEERKPKVAWNIVFSLVAAGIIVYAIFNKTEVKFYADNDLCTEMAQNKTPTCYRRDENKSYPVFISLGLGLLGILLAPTVRCLCDFVEELRQYQSRYKGNISKLFKDCFCGISWKPVIAVATIDFIALSIRQSFTLEDLMFILGGVGVGPLVTYLLNLNAQSEVDHSRFLEGRGLYPAYTLAWNYHIHYLEKLLPIFSKRFSDSNTPAQDQEGSDKRSDRDAQPKIQLNLKKLILLFSQNYKKEVKLVDLDDHISEITDICEGGYKFPVYGLKYNGKEYRYVILYAKEPLETIKTMCESERSKPVHVDQLEDQVKLLYRTLVSEILIKDDYCRNKCILVLMTAAESLENGGLVKLIMSYVRADECASNTEKLTKSPITIVKTLQPQETDDTSEQNLAPNLPCSSHTVTIDDNEGKVTDNGQGYFIPADDPDENSALLGEEKESILERGKDPLNPKLQGKKIWRIKKAEPSEWQPIVPKIYEVSVSVHDDPGTSMSSNEQAKENGREVTGPPVFSKGNEQQQPTYDNRMPATSFNISTSPSDLSGEPENQPPGVHCPSEIESRERCGISNNQPMSGRTEGTESQPTSSIYVLDGEEICPNGNRNIVEL